jgi:hypothetical protein
MGRPARDVAGFLAIYAAWVVLVNAAPGPWRRWTRGQTVDPWTLTHVAFGALAYEKGLSLVELNVLGVLNEAAEAGLRRRRPDLLWGEPESGSNIVADVAANSAGWLAWRAI